MDIVWPKDFDDFAWQIEAKGCLFGLKVRTAGQIVGLTFYDKVRLAQDVDAALSHEGFFAGTAVVVLERITKQDIEQAVEKMARTGTLRRLAPLP